LLEHIARLILKVRLTALVRKQQVGIGVTKIPVAVVAFESETASGCAIRTCLGKKRTPDPVKSDAFAIPVTHLIHHGSIRKARDLVVLIVAVPLRSASS